VLPTLEQVLLEEALKGGLSAGELTPEGVHGQRGGILREEVLDGPDKELLQGGVAGTGLREAIKGH
jgi:hypothetical protein